MKINLKNVENALKRDEMRNLRGGSSCQITTTLCYPARCPNTGTGPNGYPNSCCGLSTTCVPYSQNPELGRCCNFYY